MSDPRESYQATTLRILGNFQLLEFALKAYIGRAYRIITHCAQGKVHFGYTETDVESYPLERLLNIFSKLNSNTALIKRLNKLREDRNHIAHSSLLVAMGSKYDVAAVKETEAEFWVLEDEVSECLNAVIAEMKALTAIAKQL